MDETYTIYLTHMWQGIALSVKKTTFYCSDWTLIVCLKYVLIIEIPFTCGTLMPSFNVQRVNYPWNTLNNNGHSEPAPTSAP
jgi:hypothetical protein